VQEAQPTNAADGDDSEGGGAGNGVAVGADGGHAAAAAAPTPQQQQGKQKRTQAARQRRRKTQQAGSLPKLPAVVQLITDNFYSHRRRKQQDEDDIMVCHCPPPWRGGDGCGPACINRVLCIECTEVRAAATAAWRLACAAARPARLAGVLSAAVAHINAVWRYACGAALQGFCPCESHCTNQMFTRKQYAKLSVVSCSSQQGCCSRGGQLVAGRLACRAWLVVAL
jgi:hypothetical protein